jgi:curved DNA-binding protein CbpA
METLYDLLGALPDDGAEELRSAFRRAVKGAHPDLNPGDPDAALKFRRIVHASEILGDSEQRAAYDHLLDLARVEQRQVARHAVVSTIYKIASGVVAFVLVSIVSAGGFALITQMSAPSNTPAKPAELAASTPAESQPRAAGGERAPPVTSESSNVPSEAIVPAALTLPPETVASPAPDIGPPLELVAGDAKVMREQGILAYRSGNLDEAVAAFDRAIQLDPKFAAAYINRGIVFYRLQRFDRAYADIAHARRIEKTSRIKAEAAAAKKQRLIEAANAPPTPLFFQGWATAADPSHREGARAAKRR